VTCAAKSRAARTTKARMASEKVRAALRREWFAAFPDRRLRIREATPEEAGPARPGTRILAIVARGRAPFVFQAGRDFVRLDNDREIATLLSQMEKPFGAAN
jgi:hypothetical protein